VPFLTVLANDQGDVVGTARAEIGGSGIGLPGQTRVIARPGQRIIEIEVGEEVLNLDPLALHEFIKANYLRPVEESVSSAGSSTPANDPGDADERREKPSSASEDRNLVITPAGPMPKDSVHPVRPDEAVRRNPDGTYTVVPKTPPAKESGPTDQSAEKGRPKRR